jgi:protein-S-isoprenylcysteine O-methyltransferase Ste14
MGDARSNASIDTDFLLGLDFLRSCCCSSQSGNFANAIQWAVLSAFVACCPTLSASKLRITPTFLVEWFFALFGGIIRLACYRTLGNLFTFELSIRKNHKLITSGPYAVVRHPSYTGLIMAVLGYSLCQLSSGSWLRECSGLSLDGTVYDGIYR